jgi:acetyl esterase/lipase
LSFPGSTADAADAGSATAATTPPQIELLWPAGAPGARGSEAADKPSLTIFLPAADRANGTAVIVCPGGGYGHLATDHEGRQVAEWLNRLGVSAFMLQYRLGPRYHHPAPLQDVQRALRMVRSRAAQWRLDPRRIGVWGFSAGGHLASTAGTHFDGGQADASDPIERASSRPDFMILAYPVITMTTPYTHGGSRQNLLGKDADPQLVQSLSNEKQITPQTPPAFLFHTGDDSSVPVENSLLFYQALRGARVPAEMHIYEHGRHGVGLAQDDAVLSSWPDRLAAWLNAHGLLKRMP